MAAPPLAASYPPVPDCSARSSDDSLASSSSELPHTAASVPQSQQHLPEEPEQRTHHLLKHCLSQSQRGSALQHFNTTDAREAAKEIARMGQRELQAKFKVSSWLPEAQAEGLAASSRLTAQFEWAAAARPCSHTTHD